MRLSVLLLMSLMTVGCSTSTVSQTSPSETSPPNSDNAVIEPSNTELDDTPETTSSDVFVIDVRSKQEWDSGHVAQATHIPHTEIAERIAEVTDNKDAKIVVYCAVGGRAEKAKTALNNLGFTNVENGGGYDDVKDRF